MSNPELNSLDDYQQFVTNAIKPWPREKRIALAAALAERWLPVYESFSEEEEWGDPKILRRAVGTVWSCAVGNKLTRREQGLIKNRIGENTPHVDDFAVDVEDAIATAAIIDYALDCCVSDDNTSDVVMAMTSGFEGVAPGIYSDADEVSHEVLDSSQFKDFLKNQVRSVIEKQPPPGEEEVDVFRQDLMSTPAAWDGGVGPLPPETWQSPEITEQIENTMKLRNGLAEIFPMIAQKIQALREEYETPETQKAAAQASQNIWQLPQVQEELKKQLELLKLIGDMPQIDQEQIDALRQKI
jgi:uncharacterized protein YjaG (DUF416 family)